MIIGFSSSASKKLSFSAIAGREFICVMILRASFSGVTFQYISMNDPSSCLQGVSEFI
jgi:hypothetical protein